VRVEEVFRKLAEVYDPELDQPVTELGFIASVAVNEGSVRVLFRLPTYWCAPNFAYLMAVDIRDRIRELPWVGDVTVELQDHFAADEINRGVAASLSFRDAFPGLAVADLEELRRIFRRKAFQTRQERLLRYLLGGGVPADAIPSMRLGELPDRVDGDGDGPALLGRYLAVRQELGLDQDPASPAFTDPDGRPLGAAELQEALAAGRRTRVSMEFNAAFCRGLLQTRYPEAVHPPERGTLVAGEGTRP
jgi:metal-sulfur cluster biosynthetic enzyme